MGLASYYVWRDGGMKGATLALYSSQLVMNLAWQVIFFIAKRPGWAQVDNAGGC
jgi:tryptophan-rich sensory protein